MKILKMFALLFVFLFFQANSATSQVFGKNKVSNKDFEWRYLRTKHFDIYFYDPGEEIARMAAEIAEEAYLDLKHDLRYSAERANRIPIILHNSHNDFEQTNVILETIEESVGGFTELYKNRVVVPFEGPHGKFRHVLRHELTHAMMFNMFHGGGVGSMISTQYLYQIPLWFMEGIAEYESLGWDTESDMIMRDAVVSGYLPPLSEIYGGYMVYKGGQSLFRYIAENYGGQKIGELIIKTKFERGVNRSFLSALGVNVEEIGERWQKSLRKEYWPELAKREEPDDIAKRLTDHRKGNYYLNVKPAYSPHGDKITFLSDRSDYNDIYVMSAIDGRILRRLVKGEKSGDYEEMHWLKGGISWSPDGSRIAFTAKSGPEDALYIVDAVSGEVRQKLTFGLDAAFSPSWSPDGTRIAFVGLKAGASDLYLIELTGGRLSKLTDDTFDNTDPQWSPDGQMIAFASNRNRRSPSETGYHIEDYDIFIIELESGNIDSVVSSPYNDISPSWSPDSKKIVFSSDRNGIYNIYVADLANGNSRPLTDILTGCFNPSWSPKGDRIAFTSFQNWGWDIFVIKNPLSKLKDHELELTEFFTKLSGEEEVPAESSIALGEFGDSVTEEESTEEDIDFEVDSLKVHGYKLKFSPDIISASAQYNTYSGLGGGALVAISDVMGNHRIFLLTDLFYSLEDSDFQMLYYYLPKRIDYGFTALHTKDYYYVITDRSQVWFSDRIYGGGVFLSYPFSKFTRVDFDVTFLDISREQFSFERGWSRKKLRTLIPGINLVNDTIIWGFTGPVNGSRSVLSLEYSPDMNFNQLYFTTVSADARKYIRIGKKYNVALRFSGGASFGQNPQRFFLGGTENWINSKFSRTDTWDIESFYFARFPAPLRGTNYYELVGTRYMLLNTEFRYPFIQHISLGWPLPIAMHNIGGALFMDVGGAWTEDSTFRPVESGLNGLPRLKGLKAGYGFGLRANLGIAILKLDAAWRTNLAVSDHKPRYYFSLGSEF